MKKSTRYKFDIKKYVAPNSWRSLLEIFLTFTLILGTLATLYFVKNNHILPFIISLLLPFLYVRLFVLQHDLGHGNLFKKKKHNDFIGVFIGIILLTPYYFWRQAHAIHHARGGNADKRPWMGDINLLTVEEYRIKPWKAKLAYRLYRNPFVMFVLGSIYIFIIDQRYCGKSRGFGKKEWWSVMITNVAGLVLYGSIIAFLGIKFCLLGIFLPQWLAGIFGIYLFYVQHNFPNRYFVSNKEWNLEDSALKGASFYNLHPLLQWLTANIGYHHVHTFLPRIPFYKLKKSHDENAFFHTAPEYGLKDIFKLISLKLYDEKNTKMITWKEYRSIVRKVNLDSAVFAADTTPTSTPQ